MIRNGARFPVAMADAFPAGCALVWESISEAQDYDEKTGARSPAFDKVTGKRYGSAGSPTWTPSLPGGPARSG